MKWRRLIETAEVLQVHTRTKLQAIHDGSFCGPPVLGKGDGGCDSGPPFVTVQLVPVMFTIQDGLLAQCMEFCL